MFSHSTRLKYGSLKLIPFRSLHVFIPLLIPATVCVIASLLTMSGHIGITVLWILGPIALVAGVSFVLLKLLVPAPWKPSEDRQTVRRAIRRRSPAQQVNSVSAADSWPDLERYTPDRNLLLLDRSVSSNGIDESIIDSPLAVWKPPRRSRLDWSFSTHLGHPHRHL